MNSMCALVVTNFEIGAKVSLIIIIIDSSELKAKVSDSVKIFHFLFSVIAQLSTNFTSSFVQQMG